MAEAFLQVILDNLSTLIKEEMGLILGVDDEMKKLSSTLTTIQAVLDDAEDKHIESRPIRDSILFLFVREMQLVDRSREVVAAAAAAAREMGSLLNEPHTIYGRDEDKEKIVNMLVEDAMEKREMSVLPILGVGGGLGKTTLAQLVYNDPRVVDHFERRLWVCVSDNFDKKTLVKAMIESATMAGKEAADLQYFDALQRRLWELLSQKRYLIVLDDVWNDQQEKWLELKGILSCGSIGASIIITTRLKMVVDIMGTLPPHCVQGLEDEDCWMLLKQRAFGQQHQEEEVKFPELQVTGKQIVKKCCGVPLVAKALGGILRFKRTENEWKRVRDNT